MLTFIRTLPAFSTPNSITTEAICGISSALTFKCPVRVCNEMYYVANVSNEHAVFINKQTHSITNEQMKSFKYN
jgi:hypothetical protein